MNYTKQNFVSGQVLNAENLNHIEQGIVDLESNSSTAFAGKADKSEVQANAKSISAETTRAQAAESALSTKITEEVTRAKAAESDLSGKVTTETSRAKSAEEANARAISAEKARASGEEGRLRTAITTEENRAQQAESSLEARVSALDGSLQALGLTVVDGRICMKYVKS